MIDRADTIILYVDGICQRFGKRSESREHVGDEWGYLWERCDNCNESFDYTMDFTIKIPYGVHAERKHG